MRHLSAIAFMLTISATLPASAYTQADVDACTPDAMRLCMHAAPDERRVISCLVENKRQLSPACAAVFHRAPDVSVSRERPTRAEKTKF
jgi:hypothetical protein